MKMVRGMWLPESDDKSYMTYLDGGGKWCSYMLGEITVATALCEKMDLAVDIGANIGAVAKNISDMFTRIVAVEPSRANACCLRCNMAAQKITNVDILECAVWSETGRVGLKRDETMFTRCIDGDDADCLSLGDLFERCGAEPDFVKIDIQGGEREVLTSATDVLKSIKSVFLVEAHETEFPAAELVDVMESTGYSLGPVLSKHYVFYK